MLNNLLLGQTAEEKLYVEDVFSTYLYTGNGSTQTITNGIDLAGKGGMVWIKERTANGPGKHVVFDTARGNNFALTPNLSSAQGTGWYPSYFGGFSSTGFSLGTGVDASIGSGTSGNNYASWTFRKAAKFFDCVTWTGNGANRTISHALGVVPGLIIVKRTDTTSAWQVYHRSLANTEYMVLNTTAAKATGTTRWNSTTPTATEFSLGTDATVNASGGSYVAYLFAHDTTADGVVQCGSFTTNGSGNASAISLGWEPQYLLYKTSSDADNWRVVDAMRGLPVTAESGEPVLKPNLSDTEQADAGVIVPNSSGFSVAGASPSYTYIYLAIRRGPMRTPTDATKVFHASTASGVITTGFPVDLNMIGFWTGNAANAATRTRLIGGAPYIVTSSTAAETGTTDIGFTSNTGLTYSMSTEWINWNFRRAPGFFDVVCYTGTGSARTVSHNLGVAPEFMIVKARNETQGWACYTTGTGADSFLRLDTTAAKATNTVYWNNTSPTASSFSIGTSSNLTNEYNGARYVAYLFASCPGVSKVGSYTGTGTTQQIDCGFTNGARFVLIKRTDSTGNWLVADTARGIVAANDPSLSLNSTAAEITTVDWLDPLSTGFTVVQETTNNANVNAATYIYLAIA